MNPIVPDLEQRLSDLQTQMERLRHVPGTELAPTEERLSRLADECAEIVRRWSLTSERHARAVTRFETYLGEWHDAGARLQHDASERIQELEKLVHQEWNELKQLHEEPARQLAEHATSLTQVCLATASAAQQGFERSEARLAAIEGGLNQRLSELTRDLQAVVAELRVSRDAGPRLGAGTSPWPLEGVTRLHNQLRGAEGTEATGRALEPAQADPATARPPAGLLPEAATALTERIDTLERTLTERDASLRDTASRSVRATRAWQVAAAILAITIAGTVWFADRLRDDVLLASAQAEQAQRAQQEATAAAARQVAATREEAARQIADAQQRAERAQTVGNVLAAPDLVRYNLAGRSSLTGAAAQMHWSRSRGYVFSGSGMPVPPANAAYQVWLLVRGGAVAGETFTPDSAGTATVSAPPPAIATPVIGAIVTLESAEGSATPSGVALLARPPAPPPVPDIQ